MNKQLWEQCAPVLVCLNFCESKHKVVWPIHEVYEFKGSYGILKCTDLISR